jgi:hypothetical protein
MPFEATVLWGVVMAIVAVAIVFLLTACGGGGGY